MELDITPDEMEIGDVFGAGDSQAARIVRIGYTQRHPRHGWRTPIYVQEPDGRRYTIHADPERKERVTRS